MNMFCIAHVPILTCSRRLNRLPFKYQRNVLLLIMHLEKCIIIKNIVNKCTFVHNPQYKLCHHIKVWVFILAETLHNSKQERFTLTIHLSLNIKTQA